MPARPTPVSTGALAAAVATLNAAIAAKQDAATAGTDAEIAAAKAEALAAAAAVQVEVDALEAAGATDVEVAAAVAVLAATVATDAELAAALTANSAADRARANHTGEQAQSTIVGLVEDLAAKVAGTDPRLTDARAPTAHAHDDRYYTETEAQALLAAKADLVGGVIPTSQVPAVATGQTVTVATQAAMLALASIQVQPGDVAIRTDLAGRRFLLAAADPSVLGNWIGLETPDAVSSVNGQQGAVVLGKADVGLANADNTADAGKPVSTAQQTALNGKQPLDSDLTALAALATTAFGRSLLEQLDAASARTALNAASASDKRFDRAYSGIWLAPGRWSGHPAAGGASGVRPQGMLSLLAFPVARARALDRIAIEILVAGQAGALARLGIYASDEDGLPTGLLLDGGTCVADVVGMQEVAVNFALDPGLVWLAFVAQNCPVTGPSVRSAVANHMIAAGVALNASIGNRGGYTAQVALGALPQVPTTLSEQGAIPRPIVRAAQ